MIKVVLFIGAIVSTLMAVSPLSAQATIYYRALAISSDGVWSATDGDEPYEADAKRIALDGCKKNSTKPDECIVAAAGGPVAAWFGVWCSQDGNQMVLLHPSDYNAAWGYEDEKRFEPELNYLEEDVGKQGYSLSNCQVLVGITRDGGYDYVNKKKF